MSAFARKVKKTKMCVRVCVCRQFMLGKTTAPRSRQIDYDYLHHDTRESVNTFHFTQEK